MKPLAAMKPLPQRDVEELLTKALEHAKEGVIVGVALVTWASDGTYRTAYGGPQTVLERLGALEIIRARFISGFTGHE